MEDERNRAEELETEIKDMKRSFAALVQLKDNQLNELRDKVKDYEKICDGLRMNILAKDKELATRLK